MVVFKVASRCWWVGVSGRFRRNGHTRSQLCLDDGEGDGNVFDAVSLIMG